MGKREGRGIKRRGGKGEVWVGRGRITEGTGRDRCGREGRGMVWKKEG